MSNGENKGIFANSKLFQKIKGVKHFEVVAIVILLAVALLVYFGFFNSKTSVVSTSDSLEVAGKTNLTLYGEQLEGKLEDVLSSVKGAGDIRVMITFDGTASYVYATEESVKSNSVTNGSNETSTSQTSSTPILVKIDGEEQALICKEILPPIKGVLIVSSGASDLNVKLELQKATQTLLNVPTSNIEILVGNKK